MHLVTNFIVVFCLDFANPWHGMVWRVAHMTPPPTHTQLPMLNINTLTSHAICRVLGQHPLGIELKPLSTPTITSRAHANDGMQVP